MWNPTDYLAFGDHRARPFHDLVARIGATAPRRVVDVGCGPGTLTKTLATRWPHAALEAFDSSEDMVLAAREHGVTAELVDVADWHPASDTDVVVCNAVLQWVPGHPALMRRWIGELPAGAWLGVQVPSNFGFPSHVVIRELVLSQRWRDDLHDVRIRDELAVLSPEGYADLLLDTDCEVDAWETTYLQRLSGPDPVLDWVSGTALRPVRAVLSEDAWRDFRAELAVELRSAYPSRSDGTTWFPFRRVFVVARKRP
ncbi:MAG: trans-aconitate 2-methyltransferase [Kutzneria sp.]|nr:trans-aconitate 2-methyltransferase [Kutzneria sp.]MBV9847192.1 trans-aconitate 2-methyltransferase [Kutzneria sp.]